MADRYWVGGPGNWTDTARWSTTSGGTGGASVPTSSDDVYVDSSSFSGVGSIIINTTSAVCRDFSCTNSNSSFINGSGIASSILQVKGNFSNSYFQFSGTGRIELRSESYASVKSINNSQTFGSWDITITGFKAANTSITTDGSISIGSSSLALSINSYEFSYAVTSPSININGGYIVFHNIYQTGAGTKYFSVNTGGTYPPTIVHSGRYYHELTATLYLGNSSSQRINLGELSEFYPTSAPTFKVYASDSVTAYIGSIQVKQGTFQFSSGKTFDISSFSLSTSTLKYFQSTAGGSQYTLKSGTAGQTISFSYLDVKDSIASGATNWEALITNGNVNSGNNVGWNFYNSSGNAFMQFF